MSYKSVVNPLTHYATLLDKHFDEKTTYKIILHVIVYFDKSQYGCIPYHIKK